jgi:hypothetical protein
LQLPCQNYKLKQGSGHFADEAEATIPFSTQALSYWYLLL